MVAQTQAALTRPLTWSVGNGARWGVSLRLSSAFTPSDITSLSAHLSSKHSLKTNLCMWMSQLCLCKWFVCVEEQNIKWHKTTLLLCYRLKIPLYFCLCTFLYILAAPFDPLIILSAAYATTLSPPECLLFNIDNSQISMLQNRTVNKVRSTASVLFKKHMEKRTGFYNYKTYSCNLSIRPHGFQQ